MRGRKVLPPLESTDGGECRWFVIRRFAEGGAVARRARAFGLQIHYHNRRRLPEAIEREVDATYWESLDQMLMRMDIVSINCPHTPATFHLLSARRLNVMKPTAYLVNTARGEVVDENELARMIEAGTLAGAGLDVFEHEPAVNPHLIASPKVVALPHMGSATHEGRGDMGEKIRTGLPSQNIAACTRSGGA